MGFFLSVDYDELKQDTYKALVLSNGNKEIRFDSGNPIVDHYWYMLYLTNTPDGAFDYVTSTSSVDHFFMDGRKYHTRYLNIETDPITLYTDEEIEKMPFYKLQELIEVWTLPEQKTWEQVRAYVKEHKPELFDENFRKNDLFKIKIWKAKKV